MLIDLSLYTLMQCTSQVFLPAIVGHMPDQMVGAIRAFMEFYYLVWQSVITEDALTKINAALADFHRERDVFCTIRVQPDGFSLPCQHSLKHYSCLIQMYGAP